MPPLMMFQPNLIAQSSSIPVTWNPLDKGSSVSLTDASNLGFLVPFNGGPGKIRATSSKNSGVWYSEHTTLGNTYQTYCRIGIATSSAALNTRVGADAANVSIGYESGGIIWNGGGYVTSLGNYYSPSSGVTVGMVMNFSTLKLILYVGGVLRGQVDMPAGTYYAAGSADGSTTQSGFSSNFGASAFKYPIPSGALAYNAA